VIGDSLIIFGFGDGFVCLNTGTGIIKWKTPLGLTPGNYSESWFATDMIVENGRIYTVAGDEANPGAKASVVCLSVSDGSLIWRHDLALNDRFAWKWSKFSESSTAIFYATQSSHVVALSKTDGSVLWDSPNGSVKPLQVPIYQRSTSYRNGVVYVGSGFVDSSGDANDGGITAIDALTGNVLWQKIIPLAGNSSGYYNPSLLTDTRVSTSPLPTTDGIIITAGYCVGLMDSTGNIVWMKAPSVNGSLSIYDWQPFLCNGELYGFNNGGGSFFAFSMAEHSGFVGWISSPEQATEGTTSPFLDTTTGTLYEQSDAEELFGYNLTTGKRTFFAPLGYYIDLNTDAALSSYLVQGDRVYFLSEQYIICLSR
jgi:outer membrane protein assembly factor BamB